MTKIALLKNTLPWNQTPISYRCNEELFLAVYFKLRADGYGECRTSIYEIAEALGYCLATSLRSDSIRACSTIS